MRRSRKVKILATLGPASSDKPTIASLFAAGADVFRINMSHASHEDARQLVALIREVENETGRPIGILGDLQGPKFRIGGFATPTIDLSTGDFFVLDSDPLPGNSQRVFLDHAEILAALSPGHRIFLDDGKVRLRVVEAGTSRVRTIVEAGTRLSGKKGVSVPDTLVPLTALTPKDRADLDQLLTLGVDWIALSFVQRPEDIIELHKIVGGRAAVMAKIEKPQAVERLAEIIQFSDAIMVARGDLGVELPLERVPGLQKQITRACRKEGKPVVVATQMLESMIAASVPTRAEVSDVATAVFEGADAVMLSAESAAGLFPVEAVAMMDRIAAEVERDPTYPSVIRAQRTDPEPTGADAIAAAARHIAETIDVAAICCYTGSGTTGYRVARERPHLPIIALSPVMRTLRRLSLIWGLHCVVSEDAHDPDDMVDKACRIAFEEGFARPGQRIIITAGVPFGTPGATNMLRIAYVDRTGGASG